MAEDLQGLLEKIQTQGLDKANAEREEIVNKAKQEAEEIIAKAKAEAAAIVKSAESDSANLTARAESAVKQAARDIILKLEAELRERVMNIVQDNTANCMTPELMAEIVKSMTEAYAKSNGKTISDLTLLVSPKMLEDMTTALKGSLRASFATEPKLFADMEISGGVEVAINGNDVYYDFSDEAITEIVVAYIGPRLGSVVKAQGN